MAIFDRLLKSTVRLLCSNDNEEWTGTGFFYLNNSSNKDSKLYIVSNNHVLTNSTKINLTIGNSESKQTYSYKNPVINSHPSGLDLACFCVEDIPENGHYKYISSENIPSVSEINMLNSYEDIIMIGYPNSLIDYYNNRPITRRGICASDPKINFNGKKEILVDIACFPGSSGSPVFIYNQMGRRSSNQALILGQEFWLFLGVLYAGPQHHIESKLPIKTSEGVKYVKTTGLIPNNLGYVIKSEEILNLF